ncbi:MULTISPECIES: carboxylesterase family protein [unclassified Beijerinckia]|uniref:carboxylesterase/lipase family protein n=2 Tax=unclassified Beijerinckia TaxID=2638183 RepID=UPI001FCD98F9|nr:MULTISPECIES: carboxylesterase family protein [unclassified Beijerinckia]
MTKEAIVETRLGPVRGIGSNGTYHFRGVPFARPPVAELRLAPPQPVRLWHEVLDATRPAPIAPQLASRLARVMGDFERVQSEDCLTLTIATPGLNGRRPVIVWLHGGGFSSGSGGLDWYDGRRLAAEGDVVVVGVNYRLGALGFLYVPGVSPGNLGLLDQALALQFVRAHIDRFGGDPDNIIVMGQSAGGNSIVALFAGGLMPAGVKRAIIMSGAIGMGPQDQTTARRIGAAYLQHLGIDAESTDVRAKILALPVTALLQAQAATARAEARSGDTSPPFHLVANGVGVPADKPFNQAALGAMRGVDLLIGATQEEMCAFFSFDPAIQALDEAGLTDRARGWYGPAAEARLARVRKLRPQDRPADHLVALGTEDIFLFPALRLAENLADAGARVFTYSFDWRSPDLQLKSCHCLELPFVFGPGEAWNASPMIAGADPAIVAALSQAMRASLLAFARTGTASASALPDWPVYDRARRSTLCFDENARTENDPADFASAAELYG